MRNLIFFSFALLFSTATMAQKDAKFTIKVSSDSILLGNEIKVSFRLENAEGRNFEAPDFEPHFTLLSGPNTFTSMSMSNGQVNHIVEYSFFIQPKQTGSYYIPVASIEVNGKVLETKPLEVRVWPNPEGIKINPREQEEKIDRLGLDRSFPFFRDFPSLRDFWGDAIPQPSEEPKKKRKSYKL
jgi:hypothetical protein